jgi:DNA ligase-1
VHFSLVAAYFDEIEKRSSRLDITKALADLFAKATAQELRIIVDLSLGQLSPVYVGTVFNIAEKNMVAIIADFLGVADASIKQQMREHGDLGSVIAQYTWKQSQELSVVGVHDSLIALEKISGTGSQEKKAEHVIALLKECDPVAAKYIVRIIIGKLRLGFSDMTVIDALSWMESGDKSHHGLIESGYNICADLGLIAYDIKKNGMQSLSKITIHIGIPIRPAAAERLPTATAIIEKIGPCVAQSKLDGFRLQIHLDNTKKKQEIHFFSRHLQDMSNMFPELHDSFSKLPVETLICEGEAIGYNNQTGDFLPFQETAKRRRKHDVEATAAAFPLRIFLFDILYLNGHDLMGFGHEERRAVLAKVVRLANNDLVSLVEEKKMETAEQLEDYFEAEIAAGLEGLVVKKPNAVYQPGKRNFNWIKLKRTEQGHLEDTIDTVILGYYHGAGKRSTFGIGAFLVGVYNKQKDCFQTIAKVGTGLKDTEWKQLKKKCDDLAVDKKPSNVECARELTPDVWIFPELVCAVFADEITISPLHTANKTEKHSGFALRFPRFLGYREDKKAYEATAVSEIKRLYEDQY